MENTQNDDLQSAIDGIVNANKAKEETAVAPAKDELPDLGVPPVPPMPPVPGAPIEAPAATTETSAAPSFGVMSEPAVAATETAPAAEAPAATSTTEAPAAEPTFPKIKLTESEPAAAPVGTSTTTSELSAVKESMIEDLLPIIDKVQVAPEKKFELYKDIIESKHDKSKVPAAYEAAKGITDETKKAEALLYLIDEA